MKFRVNQRVRAKHDIFYHDLSLAAGYGDTTISIHKGSLGRVMDIDLGSESDPLDLLVLFDSGVEWFVRSDWFDAGMQGEWIVLSILSTRQALIDGGFSDAVPNIRDLLRRSQHKATGIACAFYRKRNKALRLRPYKATAGTVYAYTVSLYMAYWIPKLNPKG